jgi:signal-transduction protein with cAMP-binding, CBS, and nucleotidyltransferase domain
VVATLSHSDLRGITQKSAHFLCMNVLDYLGKGTYSACSVSPSATIGECIDKMLAEKVHRVWLQSDKLEGIVTMSDIIQLFVP